ncbi:shikimate dehydrogenase family protein [Blattabacterium cuenoti]|uniref:shikimate dehydrogenase family protein n=1 Tax=Blattabacterium cuenoti TaxID=1653831 RepID=UPI00163BCD09|nr:shikimate dehydrogenase [Blattabacterium cuenoti]
MLNNIKNQDISIFGLIGRNINYSFSKNFFLKKFKDESIHNTTYEIYDIPKIEEVHKIFQNSNVKGCNVTIPYKIKIIPFLNQIDSLAKSIGSINVIKIHKKQKIGFNTDITGFEISLKNILKKIFKKNLKALVLGTGGASKTIVFVLEKMNIPYLYVSRKKIGKTIISYKDVGKEIIQEFQIIINCTPIGTFPNIHTCPPLPYQYISQEHILYDLVYNPEKSLFLKRGEEYGSIIKNGLEMLHLQAEESWKIWNS